MSEKSPIMIKNGRNYFEYSQVAIDEYNKRKSLIDPIFEPVTQDYDSRRDPVMIDIVISMGKNAFSRGGLKIEYVHTKYKDYIQYDEYDGIESFDYDLERYKLDKIKKICNSDDDLQTQINQIKTLIDTNLYNGIWD